LNATNLKRAFSGTIAERSAAMSEFESGLVIPAPRR
jgi:hypothetical protein